MTSPPAPRATTAAAGSPPLIQVAIDAVEVATAERLAEDAVAAGADWLEVGKPFIEFHGLRGAERLIARHPGRYWLLDLMIMAGSRRYLGAARDIGAANATVTALAPEVTVAEAVALGSQLGIDVTVDLFNVADIVADGVRLAALEPAYLMVHVGVDQKRADPALSPLGALHELSRRVRVPLSYASYDAVEARAAVAAGASVIVQGEPLLSMADPRQALTGFVEDVRRPHPTGPEDPEAGAHR